MQTRPELLLSCHRPGAPECGHVLLDDAVGQGLPLPILPALAILWLVLLGLAQGLILHQLLSSRKSARDQVRVVATLEVADVVAEHGRDSLLAPGQRDLHDGLAAGVPDEGVGFRLDEILDHCHGRVEDGLDEAVGRSAQADECLDGRAVVLHDGLDNWCYESTCIQVCTGSTEQVAKLDRQLLGVGYVRIRYQGASDSGSAVIVYRGRLCTELEKHLDRRDVLVLTGENQGRRAQGAPGVGVCL
mmetsp:Transcript_115055/g.365536  ORF Transcript_115055/g.365536 Transcript_115055/m.365536 type:complete len:245 (+) Transcript_115055:2684-3418(+)